MSTLTKQKIESEEATLAPHDAVGLLVGTAMKLKDEGHSIIVKNHPAGVLIIMPGFEQKKGLIVAKARPTPTPPAASVVVNKESKQ